MAELLVPGSVYLLFVLMIILSSITLLLRGQVFPL